MNNKLKAKLNLIENIGWSYDVEDENKNDISIYFHQYSPAGEDFGFSVSFDGTIADLKSQIQSYYDDYDTDEHIKMWLQSSTSGVPSPRELVEDADDIQEMIEELLLFVANNFKVKEHPLNFNTVNDVQIYIEENFNLGSAGNRLVNNILNYAAENIVTETEQYEFFTALLDDIGLTDNEIKELRL